MSLGSNKPPIILFGNVRSGTSLIYGLFNLHPEIAGWYEPRLVWNYADPKRKTDRFEAKDATPKVKRYIRKRFKKYSRRNGNKRIMEKTPVNVFRIPYVDAIFPEAVYLYIVRDPFAQANSSAYRWKANISWSHILNRIQECPGTQYHHYLAAFFKNKLSKSFRIGGRKTSYGIKYSGIEEDLKEKTLEEVAAIQWVKACEMVEKDLLNIDSSRVMQVRYEDFVKSPHSTFEKMSSHVGLEVHSSQSIALKKKIDSDRQEKWRRIDPLIIEKMEEILSPVIHNYGYDLPSERPFVELSDRQIEENIPRHWSGKELS